jgi:hypothetical protein
MVGDSSTALLHLRKFEKLFAERFLALVDRKHGFVYGDVASDLRIVLDALSPVYLSQLDGFTR